jgi:site-specific DNA-methyltransferase (adenine-specific)
MGRETDNTLYYGDNLDVLRRYIKDESVDLIYLDPPFNSSQDYNVLFAEQDGTRAAAQIKAFDDTWRWDQEAARTYYDLVKIPGQLSSTMQAFRMVLGESNMMAYIAMMAPRLAELKRVLKPTGSIYLHCDATASHYLKLLMDAVFAPENFRNEIIWKRSLPHGNVRQMFGRCHDVILFYVRSDAAIWNRQFHPHRQEYIDQFYRYKDAKTGRVYRLVSCINPNPNRPNLTYEWRGVTKVWKWTKERMQKAHKDGLLIYSKNGIPSYKKDRKSVV